MSVFKQIWKVTETCNNGKERTKKVEVFIMPFGERENGHKFFRPYATRVELGREQIKLNHYHYYNEELLEEKPIENFMMCL